MLFEFANKLFRSKFYYEAALIYYYLYEKDKNFPIYEKSRNNALDKLVLIHKKIPKLKWRRETSENYALKVFDAMFGKDDFVTKEIEVYAEQNLSGHKEWSLLKANLYRVKNNAVWADNVNFWLSIHNLRPLKLKEVSNNKYFDALDFDRVEIVGAEKVSIIMSCYNSEKTLAFAIQSVLKQDYKNIELIIFDDCSNDGSREIIKKFSSIDGRIISYFNKKNQGTYLNRNRGIEISTGKYITVMDADDYCHPERITRQLSAIKKNPDFVAVLADWVRMSFEGRFIYKNGWEGGYQHEAVATLLFEKKRVVDKIGYYDSVRFGADSEYMNRIKKFFGLNSIFNLKEPLLFASYHQASLTGNSVFGVDNIFGSSDVRKEYKNSWQKWHDDTNNYYIPAFHFDRKFNAPKEMIIFNDRD